MTLWIMLHPVNGKIQPFCGKVPAMSAVLEVADRQISRPSGLAEEVYRRIRSDIMSLRLPPDTRVSVDSLARELGVSQTPIREALSMLEANGLVSRKHFTGYATAPRMDRAQLDELFEFRPCGDGIHRRIAQGGGNHLIADSLARLHIHVHIFRSCFRSEIAEEAVHEHDVVIKAIRARNGAAAEAAMRRHIERSYGRLRDFIKE